MGDATSKCCGSSIQEAEIGDAPRPEDPYKDPAPGQGQGPPKRSAGDSRDKDQPSSMYGMAMDDSAKEFQITLDRSDGDRLGMDVDHLDEERLAISDIVQGGLLWQWNEDHPDKTVKRGDCIVEVNGVRGDVTELVNECTKEAELVIKLVRRPRSTE